VTLSPTPGGTTRRTRTLQNQGKCQATSIRCPVLGGCTVTSPFSMHRKHPVTGAVRPHWGVDYKAAKGTPILAAATGKVELAAVKNGYGNTVIIRHESGSATLYAHLDSMSVKVGDKIKQDDQLGVAGNTGIGTGPHLHFEYVPNGQIIQSKNRIDPHPCIELTTSGSITVGDNGSVAEYSFEISLDSFVLGTTTIGATNSISANNVLPGKHILTLKVVYAPDNIGTYFVKLNDGWTFDDGSTYKADHPPQGTVVTWTVNVPAL
jgi:murein DD-endopeptidase MepM/ murein hydrolase activator NlpD